jgi:hypothetical protein
MMRRYRAGFPIASKDLFRSTVSRRFVSVSGYFNRMHSGGEAP